MSSSAQRPTRVSVAETEGRHAACPASRTRREIPAQQNPDAQQRKRQRKSSLSARPFLFSSSITWIVCDFTLVLSIAALMHLGLAEIP